MSNNILGDKIMYGYLGRLIWPFIGVTFLGASAADHALGQDASGTFVAVTEAFPDLDARAVVVREGRRDVVVLKADEATPEALAMALSVLERARQRAPLPEHGEMIPITGFVLTKDLSAERRATLAQLLQRLAARPLARVEPFGPGRWLAIEAAR